MKIWTGTTWVRDTEGKTVVGYSESDSDFNTCGTKSIDLSHNHTLSHTHTVPAHKYISPTGEVNSGSGLSNIQSILQPYIVKYMWTRTV